MQNLIEFARGAPRKIAFAYRELSSIAFISRYSLKVRREDALLNGETSWGNVRLIRFICYR